VPRSFARGFRSAGIASDRVEFDSSQRSRSARVSRGLPPPWESFVLDPFSVQTAAPPRWNALLDGGPGWSAAGGSDGPVGRGGASILSKPRPSPTWSPARPDAVMSIIAGPRGPRDPWHGLRSCEPSCGPRIAGSSPLLMAPRLCRPDLEQAFSADLAYLVASHDARRDRGNRRWKARPGRIIRAGRPGRGDCRPLSGRWFEA